MEGTATTLPCSARIDLLVYADGAKRLDNSVKDLCESGLLTGPGRIALFPSRGVAAVIEQRPDPREADQHWRLQLAPMERPIPFRDRRFRGTSEAKKSSTSKPHQHHITHENFMGGISAIFGLGRRQQEKVNSRSLRATHRRARCARESSPKPR